ncbi:hypothetical protein JQ604_01070 [Bradyrhizobium jicamae]|uniref:hypothetical protein n=1 Tax=Bradyrhizobium jicamae TaxID=280332 RepID=UPI001BAB8E35|nr:hypothetical protein [Bradyrhizobium jicamae]MBR0750770.1 hypothetical protein [Bradyrhizobium jicamae]
MNRHRALALCFEHDLFGTPLHTFPDHALTKSESARDERTKPAVIRMLRFALLLVPLAPVLLLNEIAYWTLVALTGAVCAVMIWMPDAGALRQAVARCRPAMLASTVTLLLLLLQIMPLAPLALTYPIWKSAADALGADLGNSISLDPSATLQGLLNVLFLMAGLFALAAISIDRLKARIIYRLMALGVGLLCICLLGARQFNLANLAASTMLDALGPIALIIGASLILHWRGRDSEARGRDGAIDLALGAATLALSAIALVTGRHAPIIVLALGGACLMAATCWLPVIKFNRRLPIAMAAVLALLLAAASFSPRWMHEFSLQQPRAADVVVPASVERMLSDAPPLGTGAGTFSSLARIYNPSAGDGVLAPTLLAKFAVEYGRVGTLILAFLWFAIAFELLAGAFRRNRDRYFCAAAAAIAFVGAIEGLFDASWAEASIQAVVMIAVAVGLAQRDSSVR